MPYIKMDMLLNDGEEGSAAAESISREMMDAMVTYMPLRGMLSFSEGRVTMKDLVELVDKLNEGE